MPELNRRAFLKTASATIAASSLDFNLFGQTVPGLRAPLNTALLSSMQNNLGPVITRLFNGTATRANSVAIATNQIAALRTELVRVGFQPTFRGACARFTGSDPRFSSSAMAHQITMIMQQWAPSVTYARINQIYLSSPPYNVPLPPLKLAGVIQGSLNELAINGIDQFLSEVYQTLSEVAQLIYGNFWTSTTCQYIKRALIFLSLAFQVISGICLLSGVLVEICPIARVIAFVIGVLNGFITVFLCS